MRILKLIISIIYFSVKKILSWLALLWGGKLPGKCVVLYYHSVYREDRERFAWQMDEVILRTKPVRADFNETLESGVNYSAVTFDDGLFSVVENALPELAKRNIPSTLFIPTGHFGGFKQRIGDIEYPFGGETVMSANDMKKIKNGLVSIGSHSVTHPNFLMIDEVQARSELLESKRELESLLGSEISLFSFPHGAYDDRHVELAREAKYDRVFTIWPTFAFTGSNEFMTGRIKADPSDWRLEFRLKLMGAYCWLPFAIVLKRGLYMHR